MIEGKLLLSLAEAGYQAPGMTEVIDTLAVTAVDVERRWLDISPWPFRTLSAGAVGR